MNILVCDDEHEIVEAIEIYLKNEGYSVLKAFDGEQALEKARVNDVHLVIMDIMMPKMDGIRAMMRLREMCNIPVIVLSAKTEDTDRISGLSLGADDYITKPFNPLELLARVKSQLRRYTELGGAEPRQNVYKTGGLVLDDERKTVTLDGEDVRMTPVQYRILLLLMKNVGRVFSIDEIYERVWNEVPYNADNTVAVHIRNIREKIEINPREPQYLKVVWGIGYKIEKQ
ncbi:MAG: response regulator transcription factor [Oscillospiraceae bacterium]|nr:response regulator transcription factor [Oscillospiraceae bacterium]MDR1328846.1 response regulator transcription factor [Oscillospiraceae bacterium]